MNLNIEQNTQVGSKAPKPMVCDLCKLELAKDRNLRKKCNHEGLGSQAFQARYNEILNNNFKITLDKIQGHTASLNGQILNTQDTFASYYGRIRTEIEQTIEGIISGLMHEKQELFTEINSYQTSCESHFKECSAYKEELINYLKKADEFHLKWSNRLPRSDENGEVLAAFKEAYAYLIELARKKIEYESFIFDKKLEFKRQEIPTKECHVGYLCHVLDKLPRFDQWTPIDLRKNLFLHHDKDQPVLQKSHFVVEEFESKNLFFCYVHTNPDLFNMSQIKMTVTDSDGFYLRSVTKKTFNNEFRVYKYKELILVSFYSQIAHSNLKVYNEKLERVLYVESLLPTSPITALFANDQFIYYSSASDEDQEQTIVNAMNWDMEHVQSYSLDSIFPLYVPNKVDQIECYDSKIYLKYENLITVVNEHNGEIMKVLDIPCASDFSIDMSGFFVVFCQDKKRIYYLSLNCDVLDENELIDFPIDLKFYYNKYQRSMFFYDIKRFVLYKINDEIKVFKNSIHWYLEVNK